MRFARSREAHCRLFPIFLQLTDPWNSEGVTWTNERTTTATLDSVRPPRQYYPEKQGGPALSTPSWVSEEKRRKGWTWMYQENAALNVCFFVCFCCLCVCLLHSLVFCFCFLLLSLPSEARAVPAATDAIFWEAQLVVPCWGGVVSSSTNGNHRNSRSFAAKPTSCTLERCLQEDVSSTAKETGFDRFPCSLESMKALDLGSLQRAKSSRLALRLFWRLADSVLRYNVSSYRLLRPGEFGRLSLLRGQPEVVGWRWASKKIKMGFGLKASKNPKRSCWVSTVP